MTKKRQAAEAFILKYIDKMTPGTNNRKIYEDLFKTMSHEAFDTFIEDLKSGAKFLTVILPNFQKNGVSVENNLEIADELKYSFFQRLWIEGQNDEPSYLTPNAYLIVDLPVRRASQLLIKKISVPPHNRVVDALTGQPTGESKGAKISYPELQIAAAMGLEKSMVELMKYRGGDIKGHAALSGMISKYGKAHLNVLNQYSSGVESTYTLKTFLTCMHLKSTL